MSSTAIGSASVVLSANADGLAAGLDSAERKVTDFAGDVGRKLDKVGGGGAGGGGFLSKIIGGGALAGVGGAVAGAVAGGVMKGLEVLGGVPDLIRGLAEKATGPEAGPLRGIVAALDRVQALAEKVGGTFFSAMGPGIVAVADVAARLSDRFGGLVEKVGTGFGVALTFGVEVAGELLTVVGELVESWFEWVAGFGNMEASADSAGRIAMAMFRGIAKGAAYAWDVVKVGAGVGAWVAGKLVQGFTRVMDILQAFVDLAATVPGAPRWLEGFAQGTREANATVRALGQGMEEWGAQAVAGFGQSAAQVDRWMDGVEQRFNSRSRQLAQTAEEALKPIDAKLGGALLKGSAEATSIVTKFQTQGMVSASDPARKQLAVMEEVRRLLQSIDSGLQNAPLLRAI